MGIGDDLMSAGEARAIHARTGHKALIQRADRRAYWNPVWDGVPYILRDQRGDPQYQTLISGGGPRPYIEAKSPGKWTWRPYTPLPAEIRFTDDELAFAEPWRGYVMVEPNGKAIGHSNKLWAFDRWMMLAAWAKVPLVQCGPPGARRLPAATYVPTMTFRQAAAVLSVSRAFIGGDGSLHHAAAAVGTPAVVIRGGFISHKVTGYASHKNLFTGSGLGCGMRTDCPHCRKAMQAITVDMVQDALKEIL